MAASESRMVIQMYRLKILDFVYQIDEFSVITNKKTI